MIFEYIPYAQALYDKYIAKNSGKGGEEEEPLGIGAIVDLEYMNLGLRNTKDEDKYEK